MIEIADLCKTYDDGVKILKHVNMTIPDGCIFGIVGKSGAGKSTLLRCINGLEQYQQGQITVNGVEVGNLKEKELLRFRQKMGMIFQHFALLSRKSVLENVMLPLECWKHPKAEMTKRAVSLLERVGLGEKLYAMPDELSGGQKQRVAIARALALEPTILLCDEATSALDPAITQSILALLMDINRELGITIVMVTHEMSVIKTACDRVAILDEGRVVSQGCVEEVFLQDDPALKKLIGAPAITAAPGQVLLQVTINDQKQQQMVLFQMATTCGIPFGIVCANVEPFHGKYMGHIYLSAAEQDAHRLLAYLAEQGIAAVIGKEF